MPLYGTAPSSLAHLVLAAARPPSTWPARFTSPLHTALSKTFPSLSVTLSDASHPLTKSNQPSFIDGNADNDHDESFGAFLYTPSNNNEKGNIYSLPFAVSLSTIPTLKEYFSSVTTPSSASLSSSFDKDKLENINHVFVCTHGSRDCRCGDLGEPVYKAIKRELNQRRLLSSNAHHSNKDNTFTIHRISHIGGHKWAANVLHYPSSNWYGLVTPQLVPKLVDDWVTDRVMWSNWRGRLGLDIAEQENLYRRASGTSSPSFSPSPLGDDPIEIPFRRSGDENDIVVVRAYPNEYLMTAAKRHNLVEASCDGQCECATCHVYLQDTSPMTTTTTSSSYSSSSSSASSFSLTSPPSDEELDQLDYALDRKPNSRLACQITVDENLKKWIDQGNVVGLPRF